MDVILTRLWRDMLAPTSRLVTSRNTRVAEVRLMSMQKLKELASSIDFTKPYNVKGHRVIYDHVDRLHSSDPTFMVPPPLVFYAARNILSSSFIVGQIPDLLNLLTVVETFRRFAVLKCDEALEWQKYYEREKTHGRAEDVRLLAANEVYALQRCVVQKDVQRREYIVLLRSLTLLYIHYLWTAPESCLLAKKLNDFFPGSIQGVEKPSDLLFHVDLSEDEKESFKQIKSECQYWIAQVVDWEEKREEACQGQSEKEIEEKFAVEFRDAFRQPYKPSETARNAEIYLNRVEDIVQKLEQWFPPLSAE